MEFGQLPPMNGEGLSWNGRNPDEVHLGHYLRKVPQATSSFHPRQPNSDLQRVPVRNAELPR